MDANMDVNMNVDMKLETPNSLFWVNSASESQIKRKKARDGRILKEKMDEYNRFIRYFIDKIENIDENSTYFFSNLFG